MTLVTLNFIHDVLKREEQAQRNAKKLAYRALDDAEDNNAALQEAVDKASAAWRKANTALYDFEAQDW